VVEGWSANTDAIPQNCEKYKVQVDMIESDYKVFMKQSNRLIRGIQTSYQISTIERIRLLRNRINRNMLSTVLELTNVCCFDWLHC